MWQAVGQGLQPVLGLAMVALAPFRVKPAPVKLPKRQTPQSPTSVADIDAAVQRLASKSKEWVQLSTEKRANLFEACLDSTLKAADGLASQSVDIKGTYGTGIGDELTPVIPTVMGLREYIDTLRANGQPKPLSLNRRRNGQWVASVFPKSYLALLFAGFNAEVWIKPGEEPSQGALYRRKEQGQEGEGGVALVLGAGNQISVVLMDVLHMLVAEDQVVLLKMNPVNDSLAPHVRAALKPLVDRGYVEFVFGGAVEGKAACEHPLVSCIHITGARSTFNHIVWGAAEPPVEGVPKLQIPITGELGNVTPCVVVPGKWTKAEVEYHADGVVAGLVNNSGHNCVALQVLVTDASWPQRTEFLDAIRRQLDTIPRRGAWYPGSEDKFRRFREAFPAAEELGRAGGVEGQGGADVLPHQPFLLVTGLTPEQAQTQHENWCTVLQEVVLTGTDGDAGKFLAASSKYVNEKCWGSLAMTMIIHPRQQKDHRDEFETALEDLKYGSININVPPLIGFSLAATPWGGYPGNTLRSIESGNCFVHNSLLFDHPEKGIVHAPFTTNPKPFWSAACTNTTSVAHAAFKVIAGSNKLFPGILYILVAAFHALRS